MNKKIIHYSLLIFIGIVFQSQGQSLLNPVNVATNSLVTASSYYENRSLYHPTQVIDGYYANESGSIWMAKGVNDAQAGTLPAWLKFDLRQEYTIKSVSLFNIKNSPYDDRGAKDFSLLSSADGVNYSNTILSGTLAWQNTSFQTYDFTNFVTTRYLQIEFTSAYGYYQSVGLNEVQIMAVPEPSSIALLLVSGTILMVGRRKRTR